MTFRVEQTNSGQKTLPPPTCDRAN